MRAAVWLYGVALRLLPRWFRARAAEEMLASFDARLAEARSSGARMWAVAHEVGGVLRAAVLLRLGPRRSRRPAVGSGRGSGARWLLQDVRFAARRWRRYPAVGGFAVITLALGVGASTAMFSVIDGVLLRPLPFEEPERIVTVWPTIEEWREHPSLSALWQRGRFSAVELAEWMAAQRSFDGVAGYQVWTARLATGEGAERVAVAAATADLFPLLRVQPQIGRLPAPDEREAVVVLTHAFWQSRHGGDPAVLRRSISLNDEPVRVIGVLPAAFELTGVSADLWRPLELVPAEGSRRDHSLLAVGRLRDGVSVAQAEAEAAAFLAAASAADPGHLTHGARISSPVAEATREVRLPLLILGGASLLLLVTACANVALLLLGSGAERMRELAVRRALGAARRRVAVQLFLESLLLCLAGALAALAVAALLLRVLVVLAPPDVPRLAAAAVDLRAFGFAALLALATGALVGCFPAFTLTRVDAIDAIRAGATARGRGRLQRTIVVAELALATVLLVGAGLLTRTMAELQRVEPGFDAAGLVTIKLQLPWERFRGPGVSASEMEAGIHALGQRIAGTVHGIPGVSALTQSSDMPYSGDRNTNPVEPEGYVPADGEQVDAARRIVAGNYFDVMRIAPLQGRTFTAADDHPEAEPVMVVTDRFARRFWPDGRWLDRKVGFWGSSYRVVGVIADTREHDLRGDDDKYKFYVPDRARGSASANLLFRTDAPLEAVVPLLRQRIFEVDRALVITEIRTMQDRIDASIAGYRFRMRLMVAFSVAAALFALLGVYGVMSHAVAQRRRELGVRIALGADSPRILWLVLGDGARLAMAGAAIGCAAALAASRIIEGMIWGVPRSDPATFVLMAFALLVAALLAAAWPARRAAAVEPVQAMRS